VNWLSDDVRSNVRLLGELRFCGRKPAREYPGWDEFEYPATSVAESENDQVTPVAFCGDLSPAGVLAAYRRGAFALAARGLKQRIGKRLGYAHLVVNGTAAIVGPASGNGAAVDPYWGEWWSPESRQVIGVSAVHLGKDPRRAIRRNDFVTTANTSFERVVEECRANRSVEWLTDKLKASLVALHEDGWAHSNEVWLDGELVGGSIGIGIGKVISGDSLFNRVPEASRIAIADMAARLRDAGGQLIDAQVQSALSRSVGAAPIPRADYLKVLGMSSARIEIDGSELPAKRLIPAVAVKAAATNRSAVRLPDY
jgi:leucyl/phenylalanyl-tRNA--protein transferase